jgi:hypothetical protein
MKIDPSTQNFIWFQGVVEDVSDPLRLGRCRVRIIGYHEPDKIILPTDQLPWSHPIQPITSAAVSGVGTTPTGLVPGSHVVGFFRDSETQKHPVIFGSIGGIPITKEPEKGFNDPSGTYPLDTHLNEPDTNRLARNESLENSIVQQKIDTVEQGVPTALGQEWNEPATPYSAEYPKNHVKQTESGHIQEFDDTPEAERIHTYHKSGTFDEVHPDGTKVERIIGNNYSIQKKDSNVFVRGEANLTTEGNTRLLVNKSLALEVNDGNIEIKVTKGDINISVENGNVKQRVNGDVKQHIAGNAEEIVGGNKITRVSGNYIIDASGSLILRGSPILLN